VILRTFALGEGSGARRPYARRLAAGAETDIVSAAGVTKTTLARICYVRSTRANHNDERDRAAAPTGRRPGAAGELAGPDDDVRSSRRKALIDAFFDGIEDSFVIERDAA